VLVTTARKGRANVMTLSWLTMMDFEPPRSTFRLLQNL
jgi:flavin reductase (DIM6/NTAB) family NADH-FMN oxidoreductase RutF